jgi:hypothetical protein
MVIFDNNREQSLRRRGGIMGRYEKMKNMDIVDPVAMDVKNGTVELTDEKIVVTEKLVEDMAWIHQRLAEDRECTRHSTIYSKLYGFIPQNCYHCFKIVVRPKTLSDLFKVREIQRKLDRPSKCGIEERKHVHALYGAYWYCPISEGLEGARKLYEIVKTEVEVALGPETGVILKRGCTEMELSQGPSDRWHYTQAHALMEMKLDQVYEIRRREKIQPGYIEPRIISSWIEWAHRHGDETYLEFTDGPMTRPVVTYHDSDHRNEDFPGKKD